MITVKGRTETELVVKKSRFLGLACRVDNEQQAKDIIEARKKQHYDARHNCFAYVLENGVMRYSDDDEPQGTAGLPMLDVIKKNGLEGRAGHQHAVFRRHTAGRGRARSRIYAERCGYTVRCTQSQAHPMPRLCVYVLIRRLGQNRKKAGRRGVYTG